MATAFRACAWGYAATLAVKTALAVIAVRRYQSHDPHRDHAGDEADLGAVTILQPILSGDPQLEVTLEANLLVLPEVQFMWLVDEHDTDARRTAIRLIERHPSSAIEIRLCPPAPSGTSPKSFKLALATEGAVGTILVLDDDTCLTREGAHALIAALKRSELSTGLPCYQPGSNFPSHLLSQFVNNSAILTYLAMSAVAEPRSINGMAYALNSQTLAAIGGFASIERELTDDLALARKVRQAGGRIVQTPFPQFIATDVKSVSQYVAIMHRWMLFALVLLRRERPGAQLLIGGLYGLPPVLAAAVIGAGTAGIISGHRSWHPSYRGLGAIAILFSARAIALSAMQFWVSGRVQLRPGISLLAELLQPIHFCHALIRRDIAWRSRRFRLKLDGTFDEAPL